MVLPFQLVVSGFFPFIPHPIALILAPFFSIANLEILLVVDESVYVLAISDETLALFAICPGFWIGLA